MLAHIWLCDDHNTKNWTHYVSAVVITKKQKIINQPFSGSLVIIKIQHWIIPGSIFITKLFSGFGYFVSLHHKHFI